jgi:hypothetical protein
MNEALSNNQAFSHPVDGPCRERCDNVESFSTQFANFGGGIAEKVGVVADTFEKDFFWKDGL